jgi:hypothetical protein
MVTRLLIASCVVIVAGCVDSHLASKAGAYEVKSESLAGPHHTIPVVLVHPLLDRHPGYLAVFVTGDDGWSGTSAAVFQHLADQGYALVGFSAPEILEQVVSGGHLVSTRDAVRGLQEMYTLSRRRLGLAQNTPLITIGFSRGASVIAFAAMHPELQENSAGAVAIALTRQADYLYVAPGEKRRGVQIDKHGRLLLYPAVKLLTTERIAVIQSTHDSYVPAAESRQLLGPDTPTLRLYSVESKNHGFRDAREQLMSDLDHALRWVQDGGRPTGRT